MNSSEHNVDDDNTGKKQNRRNPYGYFAFIISVFPFLFFAWYKDQSANYQVIRFTLVITGFIGLILSSYAFMLEKKGVLQSRTGVLLAVMGALLGTSIGILALLPSILHVT